MDIFQTSTLPDDEDDQQFEATDPNKPDIEALCRNDSKSFPELSYIIKCSFLPPTEE